MLYIYYIFIFQNLIFHQSVPLRQENNGREGYMRADQYMFQTKHSGQLQPRQYSVKKIYIKEYSENGVAGDLTRELTLGDIKNQPAPSGARLKILQEQKEQGS